MKKWILKQVLPPAFVFPILLVGNISVEQQSGEHLLQLNVAKCTGNFRIKCRFNTFSLIQILVNMYNNFIMNNSEIRTFKHSKNYYLMY